MESEASYKVIQGIQIIIQADEKRRNSVHLKLVLVIFVLLIMIYLNNYLNREDYLNSGNKCYYDRMFNWTESYNTYYLNNKTDRDQILIMSSLLVDILIIITVIYWVFVWTDNLLMIAVFLFYLFRIGVILVISI